MRFHEDLAFVGEICKAHDTANALVVLHVVGRRLSGFMIVIVPDGNVAAIE